MKKQLLKKLSAFIVSGMMFSASVNAQWNTNVNDIFNSNTGNVGIGTSTPNPSALLDVSSTTKGVLIPRMTLAQKNLIFPAANPSGVGMLVYQTDGIRGFYYYSGAAWVALTPSLTSYANFALSNLSATNGVNVTINPKNNDAIDLGSVAKKWRGIYAQGLVNADSGIFIGSQKALFPNGNTLELGNSVTNPDINVVSGNLNMGSAAKTIQFALPVAGGNSMMTMFPSGTANADRMVISHSPSFPTWGLQYQDGTDKFNFLSGGTPVLSADLGSQRVGVGTSSPGAKFDIAGTGIYTLNGAYSDFRLGDANYNLKMGVANAGGGAGDAYIAGSNRLYLGTSNTFNRSQTIAINNDGTVGIGSFVAGAKLGILGDTGSLGTIPTLKVTTSYKGNSDVRGIQSISKTADGYGYGIQATGGFQGGNFIADAGAYSGSAYGVVGSATGTAGTRIGVYGSASGGTVENWGGYFPTKTYTNELRVGGTKGATGYVASINGKLIATEVRVEALAAWPDYVFGANHKLLPIEELEASINANKHLPGVPSADEVKDGGIMLGAMQTKTMEKVEELTLYIIQLNKENKELKARLEKLENK